jgi:hypothetical protein
LPRRKRRPERSRELAEAEVGLKAGLAKMAASARALKEIRDQRLYRETHATFEEYALAQWDLDRAALEEALSWDRGEQSPPTV